MTDGWIGPWFDHAGPPNTDDEGIQQLIAACGCDSFDEMYEQIIAPNTSNGAGEGGVLTEFTPSGEAENAVPDTPSNGGIPAGDDGSSPRNDLDTLESTYYDLLNFGSGNSPYLIGDQDMNELIEMYEHEQSAGPEDNTTLSGGGEASGSSAYAYPTPASSTSSPTEPDEVDIKR
jgi:hypothetical protein